MTKKKTSAKKKEEPAVEVQTLEPNKHHEEGDEPSWYHYLLVVLGIVGVFLVFYIGFEVFGNDSEINQTDIKKMYVYPHKVGNVTYNLHFNLPTEDLDKLNYEIQPNKLDILNTANFTLVFKEYNGTDNGKVSVSATKIMRFLKTVYGFRFDEDNFKRYENVTCVNSTRPFKIVVFDPYTEENEVSYNSSNGCIEFNTITGDEMVYLTDKFMYEMTKQ